MSRELANCHVAGVGYDPSRQSLVLTVVIDAGKPPKPGTQITLVIPEDESEPTA